MATERQIQAIDKIGDRVPRRCPRCRRWKPQDEFARNKSKHDGLHTYCKQCMRLAAYSRYHDGGGREAKAEYLARPEVMERRKRYNEARKGVPRRESNLAYSATARGKLVRGRSEARCRLRRATDPARRAAIEARIALFDREIARLDAEAEKELALEPIGPAGDRDYRGVLRTKYGTFVVLVSVPGRGQVRGGTFATLEQARAEANRLGKELLGVDQYAVPKRRRA